MLHRTRENLWREAEETGFDVAVVGGGINGASLYHELCARGYRVLLIDRYITAFKKVVRQAKEIRTSRG